MQWERSQGNNEDKDEAWQAEQALAHQRSRPLDVPQRRAQQRPSRARLAARGAPRPRLLRLLRCESPDALLLLLLLTLPLILPQLLLPLLLILLLPPLLLLPSPPHAHAEAL
jgi:hypothetical protein